MAERSSLAQYLRTWAGPAAPRRAVAQTLEALAVAGREIGRLVALGGIAENPAAVLGVNADGDRQQALDLRAHDILLAALQAAPVAVVGSEESEVPIPLDPGAPLAVAVDPLDGSSNIDTNVALGTIFSLLPLEAEARDEPGRALLQPGSRQLAAGFVIYGPQTALVLTLGKGTAVFTLDPRSGSFLLTQPELQVPPGRREYAINASNYRFWDPAVQAYIGDCVAGAEGPLGEDFNMRWIASLVAEAFRVLRRGGIFLYPRDSRQGYSQGRLRLVYEANPIALLLEQAGGGATDGISRILNIQPRSLHQRTPLVFGSRDKVERVLRYHVEPPPFAEIAPLFGRRGLFRT